MTQLAAALLLVFVLAVLLCLAWYDVRERIIPNRIVLPAWIVVLCSQTLLRPEHWKEWLIASGVATAAFFVPALLYPPTLGMGDVKLAGLLGAVLGYGVLNGVLIGTLLAGAYSALVLVRRGSAARGTSVPYGAFLAAGAAAALLL
jgi:leader peptidase (prepilin peptidase)/N-methyltransferase